MWLIHFYQIYIWMKYRTMLIVVCLLPRNWMLPPTCWNWRGEKLHPTVKLLKNKTQAINMEESWTYLADITKRLVSHWYTPSGTKALVALTFPVFFFFFTFHLFTYLLTSYINIVVVLVIIVQFFFSSFCWV